MNSRPVTTLPFYLLFGLFAASSAVVPLAFAREGAAAAAADRSAPAGSAALIATVRTRFAQLNEGRKYLGDNPLAPDYGADDHVFAESLLPLLQELDQAVAANPEATSLLLERARFRLVYQAHFRSETGRAFRFESTQEDLAQVTALEPGNAAAWYELGLAQLSYWRTSVRESTVMNLLDSDAEKLAAKKAALTGAIHAFSRAIYAQPNASGLAHLARTWAQRALDLGGDPDQTLIDADAAITQDLSATDASWDILLHPNRTPEKRTLLLADAFTLRAKARLVRGEFTAALADLDVVLTATPGALGARLDRGKLYVRRGQYAEAISDFSVVIAARPDSAEGWLWRGVAHDGAQAYDLAASDLSAAIQRDEKIRPRIAKTRYDLASPNPQRGLAPRPSTGDSRPLPPGTALDHKNAGNQLRGQGDPYAALREYTVAALIDPNFADAFSNRGSVYSDWQELDLAMVEFDRALALDPHHRAAYFNRGFLWRELGDRQREREDFNHAVEYADNDDRRADALLARGRTIEVAGDLTLAYADYRRASELAPKKAAAWRALAYFESSVSHFADAAEHFRRSLALEPDNFHDRVVLALTLGIQDDAAAEEELAKALEKATRAQVREATDVIDQGLKLKPDSTRLQALKEQVKAKGAKTPLFV